MGIFKIGRGSFWGIIIPGGFLFVNIFVVSYSENLEDLLSQSGLGYSFIVVSILFSFVIGYVLRLIKPKYAEFVSIPIVLINSLCLRLFIKVCKLLKISTKFISSPKSLQELVERFPYINWFYSVHLEECPDIEKKFFNDFKYKEFSNSLDGMSTSFFGHCKLYVIENSNYLRDEILFAESLVRFLNGMFYALTISIITIFIKSIHLQFNYSPFNLILVAYFFFLLVILIRYKNVRKLEALICFKSFFVTYSRINENKDFISINESNEKK